MLFSTHILSEAERLCDRIGVIHRGLLLGAGTTDELRELTGKVHLDEVFRALVADGADGADGTDGEQKAAESPEGAGSAE